MFIDNYECQYQTFNRKLEILINAVQIFIYSLPSRKKSF